MVLVTNGNGGVATLIGLTVICRARVEYIYPRGKNGFNGARTCLQR